MGACGQSLTLFTISTVIGYGKENSIRPDILNNGLPEFRARRRRKTIAFNFSGSMFGVKSRGGRRRRDYADLATDGPITSRRQLRR